MNRLLTTAFVILLASAAGAQNAPALPNPEPKASDFSAIVPHQPFFVAGEALTFKVKNMWDQSLYLGTGPYYTISRNGREIHRMNLRTPFLEIPTEEAHDIRYQPEPSLPPGLYTITVRLMMQRPRPNVRVRSDELSTDFNIVKKEPGLILKITRPAFHEGRAIETMVRFYVLNLSSRKAYRDPSLVFHIDRKTRRGWDTNFYSQRIFFIRMPDPVLIAPNGGREMFSWDQGLTTEEWASTGTYRVRMTFHLDRDDGPKVEKTASFRIVR